MHGRHNSDVIFRYAFRFIRTVSLDGQQMTDSLRRTLWLFFLYLRFLIQAVENCGAFGTLWTSAMPLRDKKGS